MLANILRPLCHVVDKITIESRAMSEERDRRGRLSMVLFGTRNIGIADLETVKAWNAVLSVDQVRPLARVGESSFC